MDYWNYDKSEFESPSKLAEDDDKIEVQTWKQQFALKEFSDPTNFKSYDALKPRYEKVVFGTGRTTTTFDKIETPTVDDEESTTRSEK